MTLHHGDYTKAPLHYTAIQEAFNYRHTDGRMEHLEDDVNEYYKVAGRLLEANGGEEPSSILDIGCRFGACFIAYKERFPDAYVAGIDIVELFVKYASKRGDAQVADVHNMPFDDDQFEWITCNGSFEHFYNVEDAAKEMMCVASKGIVIVTELQGERVFATTPSHFARADDVDDWASLFAMDGWTVDAGAVGHVAKGNNVYIVAKAP